MLPISQNGTTARQGGTNGRVYGGDCTLVHIKDGTRAQVGRDLANYLDGAMRVLANLQGKPSGFDIALCPGCTMIALFNAAIVLADRYGQSRVELGRTMANAFARLANFPKHGLTEEIVVILDPDHNAYQSACA